MVLYKRIHIQKTNFKVHAQMCMNNSEIFYNLSNDKKYSTSNKNQITQLDKQLTLLKNHKFILKQGTQYNAKFYNTMQSIKHTNALL